jgi:hypothetical protein
MMKLEAACSKMGFKTSGDHRHTSESEQGTVTSIHSDSYKLLLNLLITKAVIKNAYINNCGGDEYSTGVRSISSRARMTVEILNLGLGAKRCD